MHSVRQRVFLFNTYEMPEPIYFPRSTTRVETLHMKNELSEKDGCPAQLYFTELSKGELS